MSNPTIIVRMDHEIASAAAGPSSKPVASNKEDASEGLAYAKFYKAEADCIGYLHAKRKL
jgi:hypothetical protein